MQRSLNLLLAVMFSSLVLMGCGSADQSTDNSDPAPDQQTSTTTTTATQSTSDTLPLLAIMVNLEQNMNTIQAGMWRENYNQMKRAAEGIGNHAKIPKAQIGTIKSILGPEEFKTFVADDKQVHKTALSLAKAAEQKNFKKVTDLYVDLYRGCTSCHLSHRNTIRDSPKWQ